MTSGWQPGDPVYPVETPTAEPFFVTCPDCQCRWSAADVTVCPECGQSTSPATEAPR